MVPAPLQRPHAYSYELNEIEYVSHLRIDSARLSDAGRYMCVANLQTIGSASVYKSAELFVRPGMLSALPTATPPHATPQRVQLGTLLPALNTRQLARSIPALSATIKINIWHF